MLANITDSGKEKKNHQQSPKKHQKNIGDKSEQAGQHYYIFNQNHSQI